MEISIKVEEKAIKKQLEEYVNDSTEFTESVTNFFQLEEVQELMMKVIKEFLNSDSFKSEVGNQIMEYIKSEFDSIVYDNDNIKDMINESVTDIIKERLKVKSKPEF